MTALLALQRWITDPAVQAVMNALEAAGGEDCARYVGGCVRNALLGAPVDDVDIATTLTPPEVISALEVARLKAVPTGIDHGTVTALSGGQHFEITTLRRDVATDGRRAVVAFTTDWAEDAARRDFRLNALYADRRGRLYDPTGGGLADAAVRRFVFVGDPAVRIAEDALRIPRFFRFQAWYGRGDPDPDGLAACAAGAGLIDSLSRERIGQETLKLLAAPSPADVVALMARTGVLSHLIPQADPDGGPPRLARLTATDLDLGEPADTVLRLAALLPDAPAAGAQTARRLRLDNARRDRLIAALAGPASMADMSETALRAAIYRLGARAVIDRLRLAWAADPGADVVAWRDRLSLSRDWIPPTLPVGGADALQAGLKPGPALGEALKTVETWWIDGDFTAGRDELLARLQSLVRD